MGRQDIQLQLLHQARQAGSLAFGKVENETRQRRGVDDRVF
jgi:hypothetical protein